MKTRLHTTMLVTKPADVILALQKAMKGFTTIIDQPKDTDTIDSCQLIFPVLMKKKCNELTLRHNFYGVILPTDRYVHIYSKGTYSILLFIALYDKKFDREARRIEVYQVEVKHKVRRNNCSLYKTADTACKNFIVEVVDKTWYKELEDPDTFNMNVMALKIIYPLTQFFFWVFILSIPWTLQN